MIILIVKIMVWAFFMIPAELALLLGTVCAMADKEVDVDYGYPVPKNFFRELKMEFWIIQTVIILVSWWYFSI